MSRIEFPRSDNPRASVLVLPWREASYLEKCFRALLERATRTVPFEVIVLLAGSSPEVEDAVRSLVGGVQIIDARANLGFAEANNQAAACARGEYLVLLNDDAIVEPEWLTWLVETADAHRQAGAVGSCMLWPDGTIQEAGSIIWDDGSTMPIGRHLSGEALDWHFVRQVDYCSGCSLLVRRSTWQALGGMDGEFFPIYYEDTDLCLAIRARGQQVLFEPRSRVRHHESASSSSTRYKDFLFRRNQRRLVMKWSRELLLQEPVAPTAPAAVARAVWRGRGCPPRVLVIDDCVPQGSLGSGFGRMFDILLELANHGYAVSLAPTWRATRPHDALVSSGIGIVTEDLTQHLVRPEVTYDAVIVSRPHNFERVAELVRREQPTATLLYDAEALFWRRLERQAHLTRDRIERKRVEREMRRLRELEGRIIQEADGAVAVSDEEAARMMATNGRCPVRVVFPIEPRIALTSNGFDERRDLAFVAGWLAGAGSPNVDALRWFVTDILPHLRLRVPWLRLRVTGAAVPPEMLELRSPNLIFEGHVEDLEALYNNVRAVIAPIRFGAGVKRKTTEALQYGVPTVATSVGAEGIDLHDFPAVDIADDPHLFATHVAALLTDRSVWVERRAAIIELLARWRRVPSGESWHAVLDHALREKRCHRPAIPTTSI